MERRKAGMFCTLTRKHADLSTRRVVISWERPIQTAIPSLHNCRGSYRGTHRRCDNLDLYTNMSSFFPRAAQALRDRFGMENPAVDNRDAADTAAYRARMRQEIEAYRQVENVHDLPEIFHLWSNRHVRSKMEAVFEVSSFNDFYTKYMLRYAAENPGEQVEIASLGAGNGDMEVGLGKVLRDKGFTNFRFHCMDVNPDMLARGRTLAAAAGLADHFSFEEADAARWRPAKLLAVVMAHQALHHFVELEAIFANVKAAIGDRGYRS